MAEKIVYFNGEFLPETEARMPVTDLGFHGGDGIFEVTRTFHHALFRLDDHLDRLFRSLAYVRIDPGMDRDEMRRVSQAIVERNLPRLGPDDELALWHVITRGGRAGTGELPPTVVMHCVDVNFAVLAADYLGGIRLITPGVRRMAPQSVDPKAKVTSRMNQVQAALEVGQTSPGAQPLMLDMDGNIAETHYSNFFFVRDGAVLTPHARNVLGGITRMTVLELAEELGLEAAEGDFTPYDVYGAEEAFTTGTSANLTPVVSLNGKTVGRADEDGLPGPVTLKLIRAFNDRVGLDYVAQALRHLGGNEGPGLLAEWERRVAP